MVLIITIHIIICLLLIVIILIQAGRGGGLVEGFSGVESMFGPKTNTFLTRTTTILSILFFITCLSLALLSAKQSRSLMKGIKTEEEPPGQETADQPLLPAQTTPAPQETPQQPEAKAESPQEQLPKPASPKQGAPEAQ